MRRQTYCFRILRYKPGRIDPPQHQDFEIDLLPEKSVLDGLEQIRLTLDATLMYRHCCHHASCGTCACMINGTPALACTTHLADLDSSTVNLAPLANLPCLGDLVADMRQFFTDIDADWSVLKPIKSVDSRRTPEGVTQLTQLENCIECGCCVTVCPEIPLDPDFIGPAALSALNSQRLKQPDQRNDLLKIAADVRGADRCRRHLSCSRVCPSNVYPARHIADLQRAIAAK